MSLSGRLTPVARGVALDIGVDEHQVLQILDVRGRRHRGRRWCRLAFRFRFRFRFRCGFRFRLRFGFGFGFGVGVDLKCGLGLQFGLRPLRGYAFRP
jgi:hypothetical protein